MSTDKIELESNKCANCKKCNVVNRCSRCKSAYYCNQNCQRQHWKRHKKECKPKQTKSMRRNNINNTQNTESERNVNEMEIDDENKSNFLDILPVDLIPLILCNLSNRQRSKISHVCKSFNNSIKLIINNAIKIQWNAKYNNLTEFKIEPGNGILTTNDMYLSPHQLEQKYDNTIKIYSLKSQIRNSTRTSSHRRNILAPFYAKTDNGIFYLSSTEFDTRIYVNDMIDLRWNIINMRKFNQEKNFLLQYELGIYIQTFMSASAESIGAWNIGFVLGSNIFAYHPGYNYWGVRGAARIEGKNGWGNKDMGFVPKCNQLHTFEIFINQTSHIYLKITDETDTYVCDWQHHKSLFMNKECTTFGANIFGIRIENSRGRNRCRRVGQFGDIYIEAGKRDIKTNDMSVCHLL